MFNTLFFFLCLVIGSHNQRVDGTPSTLQEDYELEKQLKLINKPPVKRIHTKFGYIVDCIDINKQPAFDHPLLKNHKLQRKPSFQLTKAKTSINISMATPMIGLEKGSCPRETVPIRRTTKEELIQAKALLSTQIMTQDDPGVHAAGVSLNVLNRDDPYHGVSGINSVWNPKVDKGQLSESLVWVKNGQGDSLNTIRVGWHVIPSLHGDNRTHDFILWTSDNFKKTGCYNLQCPGFIQTHSDFPIGAILAPLSIYNGIMYELSVSLIQDLNTKHWWLNMVNESVGYFPAELFSNMASADEVGWGGMTKTSVGNLSPQMGSGYFPDNHFLHACYFRQISFHDSSGRELVPGELVTEFTSNRDCFNAIYYGDVPRMAGYSLQFGGPGGSCGN